MSDKGPLQILVRVAVDNPVAVNVLMVGLLLVGWATTNRIQRESFPKVEQDVVYTSVRWLGHTPEEVEEAIVLKIEEAVHAIEGVDLLTAYANFDEGIVRAELQEGYDHQEALDNIRDAVTQLSNFPPDIEPPQIRLMAKRQEAISLVLHGPLTDQELRDLSERLRDELLDLNDISQITLSGLREKELVVQAHPSRLRELGLSLNDVIEALRGENIEANAGLLRTRSEDIQVKTGIRGYTAETIAAIPLITSARGDQLAIRDVATVVEAPTETSDRMRFDGQPAALIAVQKTSEEDVIDVVRAVKNFVAERADSLPEGVRLALWRDRTIILDQRITLLTENGLIGLILIFLSLWLFTRLKLSLWVAAGLPVAVLGSAILLEQTGVTINMISLFGLLLVSGILVDDAIVVAENVYAHLEKGLSPRRAAIVGTAEVFPAVSASILTTIVAFIPFFYMGGRIGIFVRSIPIVVICCLIMSFVESLIILPPHLAHSLKPVANRRTTVFEAIRTRVDAVVDAILRRPYGWLLRRILPYRWPVVAIGFALLIVSIGVLRGGIVRVIFFPDLDDDFIEANFILEPGAPEQRIVDFATKVEATVDTIRPTLNKEQSTPEPVIRKVLTQIGGAHSETGSVQLELLPGERRDASAASISRIWREAIGPSPETRFLLVGPRSRGPFGKPIDIELLSTNSDDLEAAAAELSEVLTAYPGVYDISDDLAVGKRELVVTLTDRGRAAGLTLGDVALQLRRGLYGHRVEVLQRGREELEVWVRFSRDARDSVSQLAAMRLKTRSGEEIPLQEAAHWESGRGLSTIKRYQRRRRVKVTAAIEASVPNPQDLISEVQNTVVPSVTSNYDGMQYSFEGQSRTRRKMMEGFTAAVPWALLGMLAILVVVFGSLLQGILVLLMIPLGIAGAIAGHYIVGIPLTVLSVWGIVALGGILVNDSIVFVDSINRRLRDGKDLIAAIHEAGISRFRPILLTTLTTAAGLLPLIMEQSRQAQFLIPMATSVAFGLIFGTIFTLGVLPAGFACINDVRCFFHWLRTGRWPSGERLEPTLSGAHE